MSESYKCSWSPAIGTATVTRNGSTIAIEHQANGNAGILIGAVHRQTRTYDSRTPDTVRVRTTIGGFEHSDRIETITRNEAWSININRCVNDMKLRSPKPPVDFLRAVRDIARRY